MLHTMILDLFLYPVNSSTQPEIVKLAADADSLRDLLSGGEDVEVYDENTLLLYKYVCTQCLVVECVACCDYYP